MRRNIEILHLDNCEETGGFATLEEIKELLNFDTSLEKTIYEKFPMEEVIMSQEASRIKGSKDIMNLFKGLELEKIDLLEAFNDIEYIGINDQKEVILCFKDLEIKASGIYNFSPQFYNRFRLRGYARHCIDIERHDIILRNINEMIPDMKDEINQYRLIKKGYDYFLRAFTSKNYKNYDNNIAVYLIIYAIEKLADKENYIYYVDRGYIGDSSMNLLFTKGDNVEVSDLCKISFSLNLSNSEIADEALRVSLRYLITDNEGRKLPAMIEEPICRITHDMGIDSLERRYNEIFKVREYEKNILDIVRTINIGEQLSQDGAYFLLKRTVERISDDKDITRETKDRFKEFKQNHLIESTLTLMKFFDRINSIETDMSERIFIERVYHQVIQDYLRHRNNRR